MQTVTPQTGVILDVVNVVHGAPGEMADKADPREGCCSLCLHEQLGSSGCSFPHLSSVSLIGNHT